MTRYVGLECHQCGQSYDPTLINSYCSKDDQPLIARFDLEPSDPKDQIQKNLNSMWRYHRFLPLNDPMNQVSLGEGDTPLIELFKLGADYHQEKLWVKDESGNPTGSFKARGLSMAVSKAKELGVKAICIPTAGNAGSALSAYCAKAGIEAHIFMPDETPEVFQMDCEIMGAQVTKVKGDISDAGRLMQKHNDGSWFDISTMKEPFRLEGKKTMGYEIAEQLNWILPDVIIYPTGGGTGLLGIWKAFYEMLSLGWIDVIPTRMVAVQVDGCDPVVQAFEGGQSSITPYKDPVFTIANGLRVPSPFADRMIMKTLYDSQGTAIAVTDDEIREGIEEFAGREGLFLSPEGAAVWYGYKKLKKNNWIRPSD
ncbi:MAG: threonine synthase, partial [Bacteroidia bacterium]|nr:threonine synthase [Bacteroidia bacterium]